MCDDQNITWCHKLDRNLLYTNQVCKVWQNRIVFKPPPEINFSTADGANVAEKWHKWKQTMELHLKLPITWKVRKIEV